MHACAFQPLQSETHHSSTEACILTRKLQTKLKTPASRRRTRPKHLLLKASKQEEQNNQCSVCKFKKEQRLCRSFPCTTTVDTAQVHLLRPNGCLNNILTCAVLLDLLQNNNHPAACQHGKLKPQPPKSSTVYAPTCKHSNQQTLSSIQRACCCIT